MFFGMINICELQITTNNKQQPVFSENKPLENMSVIKHALKQSLFSSFAIRTYSVCSSVSESFLNKENINENTLYDDVSNPDYYLENGLRKVYPYHHRYQSFCKGRWVKKKIVDAYHEEFALFSREEMERRITKGLLKVNGKIVDLNYVLKQKDCLTATIHKHELPVLACPIEILFEDENLFVVDKPPSMPVHPTGLYVKNTILSILANEYSKPDLFPIYRLDRLTSGVLVFAKSSLISTIIHEDMRSGNITKEYVCRVEGNFPEGTVICDKPLTQFYNKIGICLVDPLGKAAVTEFTKMSYNGKSSVVLCKPRTGRTHQIRVHLQFLGYPIVNDPLYNSYVFGDLKGKGGSIDKSITQLLEDMLKEKSSEWCYGRHCNNTDDLSEKKYLNFSIFKEYYKMNEELPIFKKNIDRIVYESDCHFCNTPNRNPVQSSLGLFLHACKYEGKNWSFESKMPFWVSEDWDEA